MKINSVQGYTKEEQKIIFSFFDTVLIDFDSLAEVKKIKDQFNFAIKKPRNK